MESNEIGRRERRRMATLEGFLKAALAIVVAEGFAALTLHRVAAASDYTRAALYRYFDSKEALIAALTVRVIDEIRETVSASVAEHAAETAIARLRVAVAAYRSYANENPEKLAMLSMLMADARVILPGEKTVRPTIAALEKTLAPLAALLAEAADGGALTRGVHGARAAVLFASVHGSLQLRKQAARSAHLPNTDALCDLAVDSLLAGWGLSNDGEPS